MEKDHLDKELTISAEITPSGIKAAAKLRTLAAVDRLLGSAFDRISAPIEAKTAELRAEAANRVQLTKIITSTLIEKIKSDPDFAAAVVEKHLHSVFRRHEKMATLVEASLDDLKRLPPTAEEALEGGESLSSAFLDRIERYAEDSTEDQIREKWGRILAQEIRKPGTFAAKELRILDEIDGKTASLFERICQYRIDKFIIKDFSGDLPLSEIEDLASAGLLSNPGPTGHSVRFTEQPSETGRLLFIPFGNSAIGTPYAGPPPSNLAYKNLINMNDQNLMLHVYILTSSGHRISSILEDKSDNNLERLCERLAGCLAPSEVIRYKAVDGRYQIASIHKNSAESEKDN